MVPLPPFLASQVDVEGWEWSVMKGASKVMEKKLVENIIMEYSPGVKSVLRGTPAGGETAGGSSNT